MPTAKRSSKSARSRKTPTPAPVGAVPPAPSASPAPATTPSVSPSPSGLASSVASVASYVASVASLVAKVATAMTDDGQLRIEWYFEGELRKEPINSESLPQLAMRWSYLAQSRQQWQSIGSTAMTGNSPLEDLQKLGIARTKATEILKSDRVQVCIPWVGDESKHWAARVMPWEFFLVQAAHALGCSHAPLIVRFLERAQDLGSAANPAPEPAPVVAFGVAGLPDPISPETAESLQRECFLIKDRLEAVNGPGMSPFFRRVTLIDYQRLQPEITGTLSANPGGGFITHYIGSESNRPNPRNPKKQLQHVWRPAADGGKWVPVEEAARWLANEGQAAPTLLSLSFCRSASRLAALAVAYGAHAAIGFQDDVVDELCESFFCIFYTEYRSNGWQIALAFQNTVRALAGKLHGTGVVLWSRHSLLAPTPPAIAPPVIQAEPTASASGGQPPIGVRLGLAGMGGSALESLSPPDAAGTADPLAPSPSPSPRLASPIVPLPPLEKQIDVQVVPNTSLNYSVLHNQHYLSNLKKLRLGLLRTFTILSPASVTRPISIEAEVALSVGDQLCVWRSTIDLNLPSQELQYEVCVPLTSQLTRSLRESLRSTLEVSVTYRRRLLFRKTLKVSLLAIDEWIDDQVCHLWLPSFVLPRDPAVLELVRLARRCLCTLLDNFTAGFDGYQSGEARMVDLQVQAVWATIVQEWQPGYINPPPTFSAQSQRLRSPGGIYAERAGTCIDLALLLAACLEHIGIEPFLVLCPGHAFVGYMREERPRKPDSVIAPPLFCQEDSSRYQPASVDSSMAGDMGSAGDITDKTGCPWVFGKDFHPAIRRAMAAGRMMALEATGLTCSMPFAEAQRRGGQNLSNPLEFDYLIDVTHARVPPNDVTPLPLLGK